MFAMAALGPDSYGAVAGRNFIRYSAPMLALGLAAFVIAGLDKSRQGGEPTKDNPASEGQSEK